MAAHKKNIRGLALQPILCDRVEWDFKGYAAGGTMLKDCKFFRRGFLIIKSHKQIHVSWRIA